MRNTTSARREPHAGSGLNRTAICRTMFCRYPGNGNSIPSVRTVATSAPRPPAGPPPAVGAFASGSGRAAAFAGSDVGVACVGARRGEGRFAFVGTGAASGVLVTGRGGVGVFGAGG